MVRRNYGRKISATFQYNWRYAFACCRYYGNFGRVKRRFQFGKNAKAKKSEQVESLIQIKVAMATCGIAAGSKDTMNYFIENLEKNGIAAVVTQTGCMGYCYAEPTVEITKPGKDPIVFGHVTTERAEEIIQKYLKNDELVADIIPVNFETI